MKKISPAVLFDISKSEYQAIGKVVRVFDTNELGELLPVDFKRQDDDGKFTLTNLPFGRVYAEVLIDSSSELNDVPAITNPRPCSFSKLPMIGVVGPHDGVIELCVPWAAADLVIPVNEMDLFINFLASLDRANKER